MKDMLDPDRNPPNCRSKLGPVRLKCSMANIGSKLARV